MYSGAITLVTIERLYEQFNSPYSPRHNFIKLPTVCGKVRENNLNTIVIDPSCSHCNVMKHRFNLPMSDESMRSGWLPNWADLKSFPI